MDEARSVPGARAIAALELHRVCCRFTDGTGVVTALSDVSLDVQIGEMVAVMGPSGSGKSTLVHVACGLVKPSDGEVRVLGDRPSRAARSWWAARRRRQVGVVHQRLNLVPGVDAIQNVSMPLDLDGWSRSKARAAAAEALDAAGVAHLAGAMPARLSVGEQQRVAVARAIAGGRPLVLADEPTAALDRLAGERVVALLGQLARAGRAILLVTHDSELASWADRVILLRDGAVVDHIGPTAAVGRVTPRGVTP